MTALVETINGTERTTSYAYDDDNRVSSVTTNGISESYTYDSYGRIHTKVTSNGGTAILTETYTYKENASDKPTTQVDTLTTTNAAGTVIGRYSYSYDANGNITKIDNGTYESTYAYDSANQLIRENDQAANVTWVYTYDNAGNLLTKLQYPYSEGTLGSRIRTYTLGYTDSEWGDLQTHWCGNAFSYDEIGNLTHAGSYDYTWERGRQLATMAGGGTTWSFTYDADGMRTSRSNGTKTYSYVYNGSSLSRMSVEGHTLDFTYDASGGPISVTYDGTTYFYALNLQGDITAILNGSGAAVVTYTYSAWGNLLTTSGSLKDTLGYYNPLRYRGYVYDQEVGLYYLQSRYYNAGLGRFNAPDAFTSTGQGLLGNNMFAYCNNNPVNYTDSTGNIPWHIIIGALLGGGISAFTTWLDGGTGKEILMNGLYGAAIGAFITIYPESAILFTSYDMMSMLLDCLYKGYTVEETLFAMGIAGATQLSLPQTGDIATDTLVDMTFGTGQELLNFGGQKLVEGKNRTSPNPARVTQGIISVIATGSGGAGKTSMTVFDSVGRSDLWIMH